MPDNERMSRLLAVSAVLRARRRAMIDIAKLRQDAMSETQKQRDDEMLAQRAVRDARLEQERLVRDERDRRMAPIIAMRLAAIDRSLGPADVQGPLLESLRSSVTEGSGRVTWGGTCQTCGSSWDPYTGSCRC